MVYHGISIMNPSEIGVINVTHQLSDSGLGQHLAMRPKGIIKYGKFLAKPCSTTKLSEALIKFSDKKL